MGGSFDKAGGPTGIDARNIAWYDPQTEQWHDMGGGTTGRVTFIYPDGNDVYVGGGFVTAGTVRVNYIARWSEQGSTVETERITAGDGAIISDNELRIWLDKQGPIRVTLHTIDGRQVGLLKDGWCDEGEHVVLLPNHLCNGTYLLRIEQNSSVRMQRLIIVR